MKRCPTKFTKASLILILYIILPQTASAQQRQSPRIEPTTRPIAQIKSIVVNREIVTEPSLAAVRVIRAGSRRTEKAQTGATLYDGDELKTGPTAQVKLRVFPLNEVYLDSNTRVKMGSIFTYVGSWFASLRNTFNARTRYVRLGNRGTEYTLSVAANGDCRVVVLEGIVEVQGIDARRQNQNPVTSGRTRSTTATEGPNSSPKAIRATKKSEVIITAQRHPTGGPPSIVSRTLPDEQFRAIVNEQDEKVLVFAPMEYVGRIIPNFTSFVERNNTYKQARVDILLKGMPESYEALGNVYNDWGQSAKALDAYNNAVSAAQRLAVGTPGPARDEHWRETPAFLANYAEAYRGVRLFKEAHQQVEKALRYEYMQSVGLAMAWNASGNIYLDEATVARESNNRELAQQHLRSAASAFLSASKTGDASMALTLDASVRAKAIAQNNLGETYLAWAGNDWQDGRASEAKRHYEAARLAFETAKRLYADYPYTQKSLDKTVQALSVISKSQPETTPSPQPDASPDAVPSPSPDVSILSPPPRRKLPANELSLSLAELPVNSSPQLSWITMAALVGNHMKGLRLLECEVLAGYNRLSSSFCCPDVGKCFAAIPATEITKFLSITFSLPYNRIAARPSFEELATQIDVGVPIIATFQRGNAQSYIVISGYIRKRSVIHVLKPDNTSEWISYKESHRDLSFGRWVDTIFINDHWVEPYNSMRNRKIVGAAEDLMDYLIRNDTKSYTSIQEIEKLMTSREYSRRVITEWRDNTYRLGSFRKQSIPIVTKDSPYIVRIKCSFSRGELWIIMEFDPGGKIVAFRMQPTPGSFNH